MTERRTPRVALALAAGAVIGVAVWVSGGVLALSESGSGARRLGLLPDPRPAALAGLAVAVIAFWRRSPRSLLLPLLPLGVLWLPWLPVPVPAAFLAWTGPLSTWVWAGVLAAIVLAAWPAAGGRLAAPWWLRDPRRAQVVALVASFLLSGAAAWRISPVLPAGDEPHYLVIAQSLIEDGDLQIENNHARGDYKAYFDGTLRPDYLRRGQNGAIYSVHAPGLPALVAPAFAAGGHPAVVVFLAIVAALGACLVWRLAFEVTSSAGAAWFGWAAVTLTTPFFFHGFTVYPDATGAVLVLTGVAGLVHLDARPVEPAIRTGATRTPMVALIPSRLRWVLHGAALALLPWLHTRYAGAALVVGGCLGLRLVSRRRYGDLLALAVIPAASAAAWFGFFHAVYGTFSPAAPYGHYTQSKLSNIPRALPALLLDQQFGVIPNAPVYAVALAGFAALWRDRRRLALELLALVTSYLSAVAAYHMWWGGWSAPARFAVPTLLVLGLPAAAFWARRREAGRAVALVALAVSLLVTASIALTDQGRLLFNDRTEGAARWIARVSPLVDLPAALPAFLRDGPARALAQAGLWAMVMGAAAAALTLTVRRRRAAGAPDRTTLAFESVALFAVGVMVAAGLSWRVFGTAPFEAGPGQLAMLRGFDPSATPVGIQLDPPHRLPADEVPSRLDISTAAPRRSAADPLLTVGDLAPGTYLVSAGGSPGAHGELRALVGRGADPVERWTLDPSQLPRDLVVTLPVGVNALTIAGDDEAGRTVSEVTLRPRRVLPVPERLTGDRARRAARYGSTVVYSFDDQVFLEQPGFWVRGRSDVRFAIRADDGRSSARLLVRNGPVENVVSLRSGAWKAEAMLAAGAERVVEVPLDAHARAAVIDVRAERGFRPAEVERGSTDTRYLGVWIEVLDR